MSRPTCTVVYPLYFLSSLYIFSDPYQDYFEKKAEERKEKVAKNEYQRLRNISRGQKGRIKGGGGRMLQRSCAW